MALIDRNIPKSAEPKQQSNTKRIIEHTEVKKNKPDPQTRKNIKVSPETFNLIKTISTMKSFKNYEFIDRALESYINNELTEREQRILRNLTPK